MKKITTIVVASAFAMLTTSAMAAISAPKGFYVEGNLGESFTHYKNETISELDDGFFGYQDTTNLRFDSQSNLGANLNVGYKFNPYIAAELGYTYYAPAKFNITEDVNAGMFHDSFNLASGKATNGVVDAAVKGILPLNDSGFELFAKLGVAYIDSSVSTDGFDVESEKVTSPYAGVGMQYAITSNVLANIQVDRARGNDDTGSLDLASLGLSYMFA